MRVNRTYPTIVGWSAELAKKKVREEYKAGSFGRGTVLPRISKPADIAAATSGQNDQPPVAALNIPSSSVDKVAGILQKLASTVGEFGEAMAEIGKQGAPVNVMRKTFSGLSNMLNVASTIEATATPTSSQLDDIFFGSESFTTAVDALLQLDPTEEWMKRLPMEKKKQNFYERMTYEIDRLQNLDINDADLIFFPVLRHGHYFLICINVKASKLEIIDNKSLVSGVTMKDKYGDCTTLLVTALKEYLALGSSALFWKVDELTEEVVDMSWKESENYIDCGLFVVRHMETYKGTLKKWNPGFKKKAKLNEEFLIGLRASITKADFYERMTYEIDRLQNLDINDADLIFFPVLRHGHYFLICINVKASKLEIIDNKSLVSGVTMKDKYGDCTTLLVTSLKEYLALGSSALFWKVDELTEEVVDMSWKESENYIDCGLFVVRHMETYKGTLKKWNPGFKKKAKLNEEFLIGLRARYAATIIRWSANILKNVVIKKTKLLYNKK
nr:uncharacterized protein LOC109158392 [Ipomoea batatas]